MKRLQALLHATAVALVFAGCTSTPNAGSVRPYPFKTCIVTDNVLGSMGDPITKVYDGQELKFCCAPCVDEFEANPAEFLPKLKQ